ncbi:MAG: hypothetical protein H6831_00885 [Planctomycetes bacterium]|nr:hypothetical protein [Planctomycetota bacterium]MCB9902939.1 hypothetical protein [Planctomycetota bacterium]
MNHAHPLRLALIVLASLNALAEPAACDENAFTFDAGAITQAAAEANAILGASVTISLDTSGDGPGVSFKHGDVDDQGSYSSTESEGDDTKFIVVDTKELDEDFDDIADDVERQRQLLRLIFIHEFRHCTPGEGGLGRSGGVSCEHLSDIKADAAGCEDDIKDVKDDPTLSAAEKCKRIGLLCRFYREFQDIANTPEAVQQAYTHCSHLLVQPAEDRLIPDTAECPAADCPVHETDFGVAR